MLHKQLFEECSATSIMSSPLVTIKPFDSVETAAAVMARKWIKRLVAVEQEGSLAGVLSFTDIARKLTSIVANDYSRYGHLKAILYIGLLKSIVFKQAQEHDLRTYFDEKRRVLCWNLRVVASSQGFVRAGPLRYEMQPNR